MSLKSNPAIVMRSVGDLLPYERNARMHSDLQIMKLGESIREFGFTNPVLITNAGKIIAGHGRLEAAKKIGLDEIPCICLDHLDENQVKAYTIADNQLPNMATWDFDVLSVEIDELREDGFDLFSLGFTKEELDEMTGSPDEPFEEEEEKKKPESDTTICPKCHHEFVL